MPLFMDVHHSLPEGATAEAPDADTAFTVHKEAHGLVADEIYPVVQG